MRNHPPKSPIKNRPAIVRASVLVFLGGACYGFNATCYKFSYAAGFSSAQTAAAQVWFAFFFFAAFLAVRLVAGRGWDRIGARDTLKLLGLGCITCATTILYTFAMSALPVPLALTLLFQFTWIGTVIQVVMTRRAPAACQIVAAAVIVVGTVFASGLYATDLSSCDPWGVAAGLAAAVCCALFLAFSGRVQPACSQAQRGFIGARDTLKLLGLGCITCATTILYTFAMSALPVPLALTLLFQFTWIGTVIQVVMTRRAPAACQVVAAAVIVVGTVFASGLYATDLSSCDPWGVAAGLAAAVCCALFLALSGRVQPAAHRRSAGSSSVAVRLRARISFARISSSRAFCLRVSRRTAWS